MILRATIVIVSVIFIIAILASARPNLPRMKVQKIPRIEDHPDVVGDGVREITPAQFPKRSIRVDEIEPRGL